MSFEQTLTQLENAIAIEIGAVYHRSAEDVLASMKDSAFYKALSDERTGLWRDGVSVNFRRYQDEIEYGTWEKHESSGIVE